MIKINNNIEAQTKQHKDTTRELTAQLNTITDQIRMRDKLYCK